MKNYASMTYVGTYRQQCKDWMLSRLLYNVPVSGNAETALTSYAQFTHVVLYNRNAKPLRFAVSRPKILTLEDLRGMGYPCSKKPHSQQYIVFTLHAITENVATKTVLEKRTSPVVFSIDAFAKTPEKRKQIHKYLKAVVRKRAGRSLSRVQEFLPREIIDCSADQLMVSDGTQLYFINQLFQPETTMKASGKPKLTSIDLFAGCGGLSLGLERAGFTPVLVNELNQDAMSTYLENRKAEFPWLWKNNISNVKDLVLNPAILDGFRDAIQSNLGIDIYNRELDLICGGPPCQGFSGLGIRRSFSVEKKQLPSNYLYQDMAFLINKIQPKIFLFENVKGLLSAKWTDEGRKGEIFEDVLRTFREIGSYHVRYKLVHAKDYGVAQNRPRVLIVGLRKDLFSEPTTNSDAVTDGFLPHPVGGYPTIEELLGDLIDESYLKGGKTDCYPKPATSNVQKHLRTKRDGKVARQGEKLTDHEYSNHSDYIVEKFTEMIANGGEIPKRFKTKKFAQKVLPKSWGGAGPTITACSAPDDYVHFSQPRSLTVREWARLQMFPDWYQFCGKRTTGGIRRAGNPREGIFDRELPKYTQIGNAVPVELAYHVGLHFAKLLGKDNGKIV